MILQTVRTFIGERNWHNLMRSILIQLSSATLKRGNYSPEEMIRLMWDENSPGLCERCWQKCGCVSSSIHKNIFYSRFSYFALPFLCLYVSLKDTFTV